MLTVQLERFLDTLERDEMTLLAWGSVDAGFTESEVRDRADACAASIEPPSVSPSELIEGLLSEKQLFYFSSPRGTIFRTRMAETVRLVARLRQLFPRDLQQDTWRSAASLVADYRLSLRPRQYPRREFGWDVLRAELLDLHASPLELDTIEAIARAPGREGGLARFQMDATMEILRAAQRPRSSGVVISAGTGTGKTLAFYMPALAVVAGLVDARHWLKAIALYPRVELLKDQFSQAIVEARMVSNVLRKKHKREPPCRSAVQRNARRSGGSRADMAAPRGGPRLSLPPLSGLRSGDGVARHHPPAELGEPSLFAHILLWVGLRVGSRSHPSADERQPAGRSAHDHRNAQSVHGLEHRPPHHRPWHPSSGTAAHRPRRRGAHI